MARSGGRLLRERHEGSERAVPVCVAIRAATLVQVDRYARELQIAPGRALEEALFMWLQREEVRRRRHVVAEARRLASSCEDWEPVGDLIELDAWQRLFGDSSRGEPVPMVRECRPIGKSRGRKTSGPAGDAPRGAPGGTTPSRLSARP